MSDLEGELPGCALLIRGWQVKKNCKKKKKQGCFLEQVVVGSQKVGTTDQKVKVLVFVEDGCPSTGCDVFFLHEIIQESLATEKQGQRLVICITCVLKTRLKSTEMDSVDFCDASYPEPKGFNVERTRSDVHGVRRC